MTCSLLHLQHSQSASDAVLHSQEDFQQPWDGDHVGLLPHSASWLLDGDNSTMYTYAAYTATHPLRWGKASDHYCCKKFKVGCDVASA